MHVKDAIASKQNVTLWANQARNQGGGQLEHLSPPEIFKTFHSNFDICRNLQIIKLKLCILIILRKVLLKLFFVLLVNYILTRYILRQVI